MAIIKRSFDLRLGEQLQNSNRVLGAAQHKDAISVANNSMLLSRT